jgi:hypothetical protein
VNEPTIDFEALVDSYLEPVTNSLMSMWYPSQFRLPACIHHYTTASSLQSIIEHHELWATDARYLNDPRELVRAEELIASALREAESRISNEWASRFIGEAILHNRPLLIFGEPLDIFVVSFSAVTTICSASGEDIRVLQAATALLLIVVSWRAFTGRTCHCGTSFIEATNKSSTYAPL